MISRKIKILLLLTIGTLLTFETSAQIRSRQNRLFNTREILSDQRFGVTAGLGLSSYYGDLCDKWECMQPRPNFGIGAMLRMSDYLGIKAEINYFRLYSDDVWEQRNLDFRSNNVEFYLAGYYQLNSYQRFAHRRKPWNIYLFAGIGLTYFSPQGSINGEWYNLRPLETEGVSYSPITAIVPFGLATSLELSRNIDIIIEAGYRKTFTDRLDDVSSREWQPVGSFDDETAANLANKTGMGDSYWLETGQYRGNPTKKDGYFISQVKIKYTISTRRTNYRLRRSPLRKRY